MTATGTATDTSVSSISPTTPISTPAPQSEGSLSPRSKFKGILFQCPIPEDSYSDVIQHLRQNFFADEPLNRSVDLCQRGEPHAELEEHSLSTMKDLLSIVALDVHTKEVIGVALNGILHKGDLEDAHEKILSLSDPKFQRIISLLNSVNRQLDLFNQFNLTEIFECRILSVDSRHRGQGLASELLRRSEIVARENNFKVYEGCTRSCVTRFAAAQCNLPGLLPVVGRYDIFYTELEITRVPASILLKEDSTGLYSQRVAESLGLRTVYSLPYSEYTDPDSGEPVFETSEPHRFFKVMIKEMF